jgi:hypothetical protein
MNTKPNPSRARPLRDSPYPLSVLTHGFAHRSPSIQDDDISLQGKAAILVGREIVVSNPPEGICRGAIDKRPDSLKHHYIIIGFFKLESR